MATPKFFETGAMKLEMGLNPGTPSNGWNGAANAGAPRTLGSSDSFPWVEFGNNMSIKTKEDDSVTTRAFKSAPRKVGEDVDLSIGYYNRFNGMDHFFYWMFGFENTPLDVVAFKGAWDGAVPEPGDTFEDTDSNDFTFLRSEVVDSSVTLLIFELTGGSAPTLQTGTLTHIAGTGSDLVFTEHSGLQYEHLFELDASGRRYRNYTVAEAAVEGVTVADKKNLMCTLAKRMDAYDLRYKNAMCKSFSLSNSPDDVGSWSASFLAPTEERGSFGSASWTLPANMDTLDNTIAHYQTSFEIGVDEDNLVSLGMGAVDVSVDVPTKVERIMGSGFAIAEPLLEGKYDIKMTGTIARHDVETYQTYRDDWTSVIVRMRSFYGWQMQEILVEDAKLSQAGPDNGDIAAEPIELSIGFKQTTVWTKHLHGTQRIQQSPLLLRVRNNNPVNSMVV